MSAPLKCWKRALFTVAAGNLMSNGGMMITWLWPGDMRSTVRPTWVIWCAQWLAMGVRHGVRRSWSLITTWKVADAMRTLMRHSTVRRVTAACGALACAVHFTIVTVKTANWLRRTLQMADIHGQRVRLLNWQDLIWARVPTMKLQMYLFLLRSVSLVLYNRTVCNSL